MAHNSPLKTQSRSQEIAMIWRDNRWLYVITGLLFGILIFPAIEQLTGDLNHLIGNLVPEAVGIIFTVLILDRLAENRSREDLKTRLFNELRSPAIGQGTAALAWLKRENWIDSDTLIGADLHRVNWQAAYIGGMNLNSANLNGANLRNVSNQITDEMGTIHNYPIDLSQASLRYIHLEEAVLVGADLREAQLTHAHLAHAVLVNADLTGADLNDAYLEHVKWVDSSGEYPAILPDGSLWTSATDMRRFTDSQHPDFESTREKIYSIRQDLHKIT